MKGVFIIPTGIGAEIGGHAGDASPAAKLIASCCEKLIVHPNVVNASDINEMTENMLYVEGSILDRFLEGAIQLREVNQNKILIVANAPITNDTINAVSAARVTIGIRAEVLELETPFEMVGRFEDRKATGDVRGWRELVEQVAEHDFDALAIHTPITIPKSIALSYFRNGGVNPWGGVEALASSLIAGALNKPVAHAPVESSSPGDELYDFSEIVNPRVAPEILSKCFFHCVLKGLNRAPIIGDGLSNSDIDFLITPDLCYGRPHIACERAGIPVIVVKENKTIADSPMPDDFIFVDNYLEAAGIVMSMRSGVYYPSVTKSRV